MKALTFATNIFEQKLAGYDIIFYNFRLVDISEIRLKISLETAPTQRPRGVLGIWSPVLSAVGNALKIQVAEHYLLANHVGTRSKLTYILKFMFLVQCSPNLVDMYSGPHEGNYCSEES